MAYQCKDCGNKSSRRFPGGRCPACDSFNVASVVTSSDGASLVRKKPDSKFKKAMAMGLWLLFFYGVWYEYLRDWT